MPFGERRVSRRLLERMQVVHAQHQGEFAETDDMTIVVIKRLADNPRVPQRYLHWLMAEHHANLMSERREAAATARHARATGQDILKAATPRAWATSSDGPGTWWRSPSARSCGSLTGSP